MVEVPEFLKEISFQSMVKCSSVDVEELIANKKRVYVISNTRQEYMRYCEQNKLNPRKDAVFVFGVEVFHGIENPDVVYTGSYWKRNDLGELKTVIRSRIRNSKN